MGSAAEFTRDFELLEMLTHYPIFLKILIVTMPIPYGCAVNKLRNCSIKIQHCCVVEGIKTLKNAAKMEVVLMTPHFYYNPYRESPIITRLHLIRQATVPSLGVRKYNESMESWIHYSTPRINRTCVYISTCQSSTQAHANPPRHNDPPRSQSDQARRRSNSASAS